MGQLRIKADECKYQECSRWLNEWFLNYINNDKAITDKISKELTAVKDTNRMISKQVLACMQRVEAQRSQRVILDTIRKQKEFDVVRCTMKPKHKTIR